MYTKLGSGEYRLWTGRKHPKLIELIKSMLRQPGNRAWGCRVMTKLFFLFPLHKDGFIQVRHDNVGVRGVNASISLFVS